MKPLFLLLVLLNPVELTASDSVDVWEVNSYYDPCGKHVFDQQIAWDWNGERHEVVAWRLIKSPEQLPQRDWERGGWTCLWQDGEVVRRVNAVGYRRTWTQDGYAGDPERNDLEMLPKERRKELSPVLQRNRPSVLAPGH